VAQIKKRDTSRGPRYDVRYRLPTGEVRTKTHRTKKEAERFAAITEADKARGELIDPRAGQETFAEWWARWWPTTVNLRPSSRARDESYARNHLLPRFGSLPLAAIDHTEVTRWVADLNASGLAPATVVKAAQILGKTMGAAVDAGRIRTDPTARVKLPKIEHHEMRFLTPGEVATLADAIDPRYRALVLVGAYCGLRFGELAGLKRDRVDLLHRRLEVLEIVTEVKGKHYTGPPKTRAGRRSVPLPRVVVDALTEHLADTPGEIVFPAPEGGYLRGSLFRPRIWQPATRAAGLEGLRLHDLRHTAVALWIAAGASPKAIAARAGHSSVVTVLDRYGHLLPGHEDAVNDALDAMADAASPAPSAPVRAMDARWNRDEAGEDAGSSAKNTG
jgi:integrase